MRAPLPGSAFLGCLLCATALHAGEMRGLESHVHGHATMQIAVDGNDASIALEIPGESVVGFEHEAETDEQKAAVASAREQLADGDAVLVLPASAGCALGEAEVEVHAEGDHNAFEVAYSYSCSDTGALSSVETKLFELYPAIEEIEVEYATGGGQGAVELEPGNAVVQLPASS